MSICEQAMNLQRGTSLPPPRSTRSPSLLTASSWSAIPFGTNGFATFQSGSTRSETCSATAERSAPTGCQGASRHPRDAREVGQGATWQSAPAGRDDLGQGQGPRRPPSRPAQRVEILSIAGVPSWPVPTSPPPATALAFSGPRKNSSRLSEAPRQGTRFCYHGRRLERDGRLRPPPPP